MKFYRFFPEKYRLATRHLTAFQDGCYRRLIDEYMTTRRPLPDNDIALAGICRVSLDDWLGLACGIVRAYFEQKDGMLFQENCDQELDWQDGKSKIATEKGKKGAEARHRKNKDLDSTGIPQAEPLPARVKSKDKEPKGSLPPYSPPTEKSEQLNLDGVENAKPKPKRNKSTVPENFEPDFAAIKLAADYGIDVQQACREFIDYWRGEGGSKADWQATFRNRIRKIAQRRAENEARRSAGNGRTQDVVGATFRAREARHNREG